MTIVYIPLVIFPDMSSPTVPRKWKVGVGVLYLLVALYAIVVMQQVILGVVVPAIIIWITYFSWRVLKLLENGSQDDAEIETDPIQTLKQRYATGEIGEEEFEHRLEQLLKADYPEVGNIGDSPQSVQEREQQTAVDSDR